jgi:hypothetical protein
MFMIRTKCLHCVVCEAVVQEQDLSELSLLLNCTYSGTLILWEAVKFRKTCSNRLSSNSSSISIQPLGRFWQEPEPSQATGMALARCILGKFLGIVCHCFPLPLDIPTFAVRCLHTLNNMSTPSSKRWKCGWEWCPVILPKLRIYIYIHTHTHTYRCGPVSTGNTFQDLLR